MSFARSVHRHSLAWIACLAILFNALAPLAVQAVSPEAAGAFAELCTTRGIERATSDGGAPEQAGAMQHCPFCIAQHTPFIPASGTLPPLPQADTAPVRPPQSLHALRPASARTAARPRAPPALV